MSSGGPKVSYPNAEMSSGGPNLSYPSAEMNSGGPNLSYPSAEIVPGEVADDAYLHIRGRKVTYPAIDFADFDHQGTGLVVKIAK